MSAEYGNIQNIPTPFMWVTAGTREVERVTEDGSERITEDGKQRIEE